MKRIHPTAIVDASAEIPDDVEIGPYTIVEEDVTIGAGSRIGAHVTLAAHLTLGGGARVFNYACIGTPSQDLKHKGETSRTVIGDNVIVREFVTVNRGTREKGITRIGDGVVLLSYAHIAHECTIGDGAIIVNAAQLAGEVVVGAGAMIGGNVGVHQFCRIGELAIVGGNSKVTMDIGPMLTVDGHPARPFGPNREGLRRRGYSAERVREVQRIYNLLFATGLSLEVALGAIQEKFGESETARTIMDFYSESTRSYARPRPKAMEWSTDEA